MKFLILILSFVLTLTAQAAVYPAASPAYADVLAAYNSCSPSGGDTVTIPAGTAYWKNSEAISCTKQVSIIGAGIGQTIIYAYADTTYTVISFPTIVGKVHRLSGIEFRGPVRTGVTASAATNVFTLTNHQFVIGNKVQFASNTTYLKTPTIGGAPIIPTSGVASSTPSANTVFYIKTIPTADTFTLSATSGGAELDITTDMTSGCVFLSLINNTNTGPFNVSGYGQARIDNCAFYEVYSGQITKWYHAYGVIDHCDIKLNNENSRFVMIANPNDPTNSSRGWGDWDWEQPTNFGSADALYIENCTLRKYGFTAASSIYGFLDSINGGGRVVIRNNNIINTKCTFHGTETSARYRSGRKMEYYRNSIDISTLTGTSVDICDMRGGAYMGFDNKFTGSTSSTIHFACYRRYLDASTWMIADGTKAWDIPDLSDDSSTPGPLNVGTGAGDGVFYGGTATSASSNTASPYTNTVTDSSKSFTPSALINYHLRQVNPITAVSGGVRSLTVSGTPWTGINWSGWELTRVSDNAKTKVASNTDNTLTLSSNYWAMDCTGGGDYVLSFSAIIVGNDATTITTGPGYNNQIRSFKSGYAFEVRKLASAIDTTGMSLTTPLTNNSSYVNHQNIGQTRTDPAYGWMNIKRANTSTAWSAGTLVGFSVEFPITANTDYFTAVSKDAQTSTTSPFDGSTGTGWGTLANRPTTGLLTGVGYWATDQGTWNQSVSGTVAASALEADDYVEIVSVGTTDFTLIGAASNTVGDIFEATGPGTGTGTAKAAQGLLYTATGPTTWALKYTPYTYPHPLISGVSLDVTAPTVSTASISSSGLSFIVTLSEDVQNVSAAHYTLSGGHTLGTAVVASNVITFPVSPVVTNGETVTFSYTSGSGRTADLVGNLLATIASQSVTNNSLEITPVPNRPGRKGRGSRGAVQGK